MVTISHDGEQSCCAVLVPGACFGAVLCGERAQHPRSSFDRSASLIVGPSSLARLHLRRMAQSVS